MSRNEERIIDDQVSRTTVGMAGSGDCELEVVRRRDTAFFDKGKFLADGRVSRWRIGSPSASPYLAGDSPSNYWRGQRLITTYESSAAPVSYYTTLAHLA